ncbi:hypothetical protein EC991_006238 [Linnemannia zychae]|nr:hypothetical protein EC991_006238 [Linnemannia zychae]
MFKSTLLLGLVLAASSVNASITFWEHGGKIGRRISCNKTPWYNQCYYIAGDFANIGLSSAQFVNEEIFKSKYSVTLYSSNDCYGNFDRWSFSRGINEEYSIHGFQSLNDNVRSFKIADYETSTTTGWASQHESTKMADCRW